jgi:hypothetical protein
MAAASDERVFVQNHGQFIRLRARKYQTGLMYCAGA